MSELKFEETPSPVKSEKSIYVYYNPKPTLRVCLKFSQTQLSDYSLSQLISLSIKTLREEYLLDIKPSEGNYGIFPANKTGSKREGYPELDKKLAVTKTNFRRFYLQDFYHSVSMISTEYNLQKKYGVEKKAKQQQNCCFLMKLFTI